MVTKNRVVETTIKMGKNTRVLDIKHVNWGVANRFDDAIEINKHLKQFPKLYYPILRHEINHTDSVFSIEDLKHDLNSEHKVNQWDLILFMFKHPKSFSQLLPIYWTKRRGLIIDLNLSIIYLVIAAIIGSSIFVGLKYL